MECQDTSHKYRLLRANLGIRFPYLVLKPNVQYELIVARL